jgi:hypothetical protein
LVAFFQLSHFDVELGVQHDKAFFFRFDGCFNATIGGFWKIFVILVILGSFVIVFQCLLRMEEILGS